MNRGQRSATRTKSFIKNALRELMREKNYPDITVGEITARGNVGRSTLYKHYQSKADVLVDIHKDIFEHLFRSLSSAEAWFAPKPPPEWLLFLAESRRSGINPFSLSYKLRGDLDYLVSTINHQLSSTVEQNLRTVFGDADRSIPIPILAQSISHLFTGLIMAWFTRFQSYDVRRFAAILHTMVKALISEALRP